jgi:predicted transcriptional regulator
MTYKTGSIGEFMQWTKRVVVEPAVAKQAPKRWFDSERTVAKALGAAASPEAMVKLLSSDNLRLLQMIGMSRPQSLNDLAALSGRKASNLSRTLKKLQQAGIIGFESGPGRTIAPRLLARRVTLELDFMGNGGAVSVEGQSAGWNG